MSAAMLKREMKAVSEMVELVARAIYEVSPPMRYEGDKLVAWTWEDEARLGSREGRRARQKARAAITAMREPTEAMLAAVVPEPTHLYGEGGRGEDYQRDMKAAVTVERLVFRTKWLDAIDAALAEPGQ